MIEGSNPRTILRRNYVAHAFKDSTPRLPRRHRWWCSGTRGWSMVERKREVLALTAPPSDAWIGRIKGKYRQVFDNTSPNEGWGAAFPLNFIDSTKEAMKVADADITAVSVFRHFAMPLLLNDAVWAKYHIGEMLNVKDPKTSAFATRNIFRDAVPLREGLTYEKEMANGVIFVACNLALTVISGMAAPKAKVTADAREKRIRSRAAAGCQISCVGRVRRQIALSKRNARAAQDFGTSLIHRGLISDLFRVSTLGAGS